MKNNLTFRIVQDSLGDALIKIVKDFVASDLPTIATLEADTFEHVVDPAHRKAIATAFYEAQWIYKCGFALMVRDEQQSAHVRAQVYMYGSVCEGLLKDWLSYADAKGKLTKPLKPLSDPVINRKDLTFHAVITKGRSEGLITTGQATRLQHLRTDRNFVHANLAAATNSERFYIDRGMKYYKLCHELNVLIRNWKANNP